MNNKQLLGHRIKELRKSKGYTQEKLAESIGIETNSLSAIESGRHFPSLITLEKISDCLEVNMQAFFEFKYIKSEEEMRENILQNIKLLRTDAIFFIYKMTEYYKNL